MDVDKFGNQRIDWGPKTVISAIFEVMRRFDNLVEKVRQLEAKTERLESGESEGCHIPSDFPHREILVDTNGITSLCELAEYDEFTELQDIGPSRAEDIEHAFNEL